MTTTENCRFCWMCRQVCPVGHVTARETLTPHAWALTIESVKRGQLAWNRETADVMYACADCGLCRSHCVTDQPLPDAIVAARAEIVRAGAAPAVVAELDQKLRAYGNPYVAELPESSGRKGPIALFVGDTGRHVGARSVEAAMHLLRTIGIDAIPICNGRSSGLLASSLGLTETAEALGRAVIQDLDRVGVEELLVLAPDDSWTFEYVYPRRLGLTWPAAVRVREVTDVLADAASDGRLTIEPRRDVTTFAYHDPCHGPRITPARSAPRALLAAAFGADGARELFWRADRAHPCGAIGGLQFTNPDLSRRLAAARLEDAMRAGATVLLTEDATCLAHLGAGGHDSITVVGLYEALAGRLLR